ncbi:amidohydrolase [Phyllobacterium brassicacearum]|uniref:Amidohydrolase n=1 Tax=Phyllobacterium brassicacearum TaxID=314235 RepID=A0A2P7AJV5_9HYPH|nr:amidohydrolase [Phyllobacterium brassicacearum]PSH54491.1 amidohydrolase [Phyllobacterium brassicacearum]TDQ20431.1 putative TIM-barrel fold metal-dependent hydrolase [Phyllobacterium brassicacearum]
MGIASIIDTHLHLIDQSTLSYPWLSSVEALNRDFRYEEYALQAHRVGITQALHMEVDVAPSDIEAESGYIAGLAKREGSLIAGCISSCRPEEDGFAAFLERQQANPLIKGFRRVLHVMPDNLSESALFRENIKQLEGTGLTFDLCVLPSQIEKAIALIDLAPGVQFILDHCGVPDIKSEGLSEWHSKITDIAKRPNVTAKISGVVAYADSDTWRIETLEPYVHHVIESFGWDRLVWGSDWPVCTLGGGLATWVAATHALLQGCSEAEKAKLFSANAKRIWSIA